MFTLKWIYKLHITRSIKPIFKLTRWMDETVLLENKIAVSSTKMVLTATTQLLWGSRTYVTPVTRSIP